MVSWVSSWRTTSNRWRTSNWCTIMIRKYNVLPILDCRMKLILMVFAWWAHYDKQNMKNSRCDSNFRVGNRLTVKTSARLCARGVRKECDKLIHTVSFMKLQGKWGCCCSPLMKSSSLSHNMTASIEVLCIPWSCVTCMVGPQQVVHGKCAWRGILNFLSQNY